jgi:hypothetical protein
MKLTCIFQAPTAKRRKKRTDVRVSELEKELRSLRNRLEGNEVDSSASTPPNASDLERSVTQSYAESTGPVASPVEMPSAMEPLVSMTVSASPGEEQSEDVEIDEATAQLLFTKFIVDLIPHLPFIRFSPNISSRDVQRDRPTLHLASLAAAASSLHPPLGRQLVTKLEKVYANRIIINGEKSLELVQALLITAVWYHPPDRFDNLKFTQYAHMAANMALDLQIGRNKTSRTDRELSENSRTGNVEAMRTFGACYVLCSRFVSPFLILLLRSN